MAYNGVYGQGNVRCANKGNRMATTITTGSKRTRRLKASDVPAIKWDLVMEQYFVRADGTVVDGPEGATLGRLDGKGGVVWAN
jgi:hypothetical protein